ncbi:ribonucleoside-diphosphate reductase [Halovivax limisalsi]|uniref:ribonucleoside-diphosphate reductase n=1 Tax=Halovivax limisalsi TaxID=1453760 RepID=UPI001FFC2B67|nr:ribonucleoside-diphosphate reductase [Halovivax limisalsi]
MERTYTPTAVMDRASRSNRYYRNAVERHWDPAAIDLETDLENLLAHAEATDEFDRRHLDAIVTGIAKFGAGEDAVTEDLAPFAVVLEDIDDQLFLTTQLYEEAKHADFFDRYWRTVVWGVEDHLGWDRTSPRDEKWFDDSFLELFDRNKRATQRLLEDDSPETRAIAYSHYHLTVEGILAQTGYYGMSRSFGGEFEALPHLPGLVEGFERIRSDEGRHVGFGMNQLSSLVESGRVDASLIEETVTDLLPLVQGIATDERFGLGGQSAGMKPTELAAYALEKHEQRLAQIEDVSADVPDLDDLVSIDPAE